MFSVRVAKAVDAKKIARIHVDTCRVTWRGQVPDAALKKQSVKRRETFWRQRLKLGKGTVFVIESGDVVGFCDFVPSRDKDTNPNITGEIAALYVVSDHWRMGAGQVLCYHALGQARKKSYQAIILWILASNSNAMRFYESLGFARDGAVKIETASDGGNLYEMRYRLKLNQPGQAAGG
jgi:ribosomal protein S18 acetylase RimI-like enzyme